MSFNLSSNASDQEVMAEINTTPLIDVMLVLLIMLIITLPLQLHSININNPVGTPPPPAAPPEVVRLDIGADNSIAWNGEKLPDLSALDARLAGAAAQPVTPEFHVRPDKSSAYRLLAGVMSSIQRNGLKKVGVVGNEQFTN